MAKLPKVTAADPATEPPRPKGEVVTLDVKQAKAWETTRTKLLWSCPAFSHVFITMMAKGKELAIFTKDVPIAATDGKRLFLNPDTFFNYPLDQRVYIVVHEILHCIWAHCEYGYQYWRKGKVQYSDGTELPYISELMNVAADYVINDTLIEANVGEFNKDWLHNPQIATRADSAVDAYRKVFDDAKKGGKIIGVGFDQHLSPGTGDGKDPATATSGRDEGQWKAEVAAGMAAAKAQGKLPAGLERMLGEMLEPQVDWRDKIRALMARRLGTGGRSWRKLDRRLAVRGIGAPGKIGFGTGTVVIGVDTSGSMWGTIEMCFAEVGGILEDVKPERLYIMWCDARVDRVDELDEAGDLLAVREMPVPGGGGTSFVPVFQRIEELDLEPEALVYLTDGMGTFPSEKPNYPVIWGNFTKDYKYPFGDVVDIPEQKA